MGEGQTWGIPTVSVRLECPNHFENGIFYTPHSPLSNATALRYSEMTGNAYGQPASQRNPLETPAVGLKDTGIRQGQLRDW